MDRRLRYNCPNWCLTYQNDSCHQYEGCKLIIDNDRDYENCRPTDECLKYIKTENQEPSICNMSRNEISPQNETLD